MHLPAVFPDPFAIEWGHDQYGTFQSFAVGNVVQRMRWIPPGSFLMGSPESEVGRFKREVRYRVCLTQGYWLADTPVTQALWEVVMGTNPSQFKGRNNPVEQATWNDSLEFISGLNARIERLESRLPTETEWEWACRAGTTTATWLGDLQPGQEIEAPQLDAIAWYLGNANDRTHPVAQKQANPWGLYDILGNVYEWCAESSAPRDARKLDAPPGTLRIDRALRGGSWYSYARHVRAAFRYVDAPDDRIEYVGFRLARSATPKP